MSRQLAEILLNDKLIPDAKFKEAEQASKSGKSYIRYLVDSGVLSETKLLSYLSKKFSIPTVTLKNFEIPKDLIQIIPADVARKFQVLPLQMREGSIVVAICDPTLVGRLDELKFSIKMNVEPMLSLYSSFDQLFSSTYSGMAVGLSALQDGGRERQAELADDVVAFGSSSVHDIDSGTRENDAPVIKLVNGVLSEAIRRKASDIHIETYESRFRVRMRVDGALQEVTEIPGDLKRSVVARIKVMAQMDTTETRVPQDGRIKLKTQGATVDFRVNTMPVLNGEKVVLRLLNQGAVELNLNKIGMGTKQLENFRKGIHSANGMVLVTGPTGSGKTTTLYSAIAELNKTTENISTAEDPVEYNMAGVNQVHVNKEVGLTFASVLRALLRQDPDIILVGEIRDYETAETAIQAAMTGHLVLSTLHTNDAPSTITRLLNMGVEPFLIVAALNVVVAQRLLRQICASCKTEETIEQKELIAAGFSEELAKTVKTFVGRGCQKCNNSGFLGRAAVYEVMNFSPKLKEMVLSGESMIAIKRQAIAEGMETLRISALKKVVEGSTSFSEALSKTMEG